MTTIIVHTYAKRDVIVSQGNVVRKYNDVSEASHQRLLRYASRGNYTSTQLPDPVRSTTIYLQPGQHCPYRNES